MTMIGKLRQHVELACVGMVAASAIAFSSSAIAAKDDALIEATRKNQLAHDAQDSQKKPSSEQSAGVAKKLVLPLDHGPHAVVTPWVNQQRRLRAEDEAKKKLADPNSGIQSPDSK